MSDPVAGEGSARLTSCVAPGSGFLQYSLVNAVMTANRLTAVLNRHTCAGQRQGSVSLSM
jgi:hypothetical protein